MLKFSKGNSHGIKSSCLFYLAFLFVLGMYCFFFKTNISLVFHAENKYIIIFNGKDKVQEKRMVLSVTYMEQTLSRPQAIPKTILTTPTTHGY